MENSWQKLLNFLRYPLFKVGDSIFTLISLADLLILLFLVYGFARLTKWIAKRWLLARLGVDDLGSQEAIAKLLAYIVAILGSILGLRIVGVNLTSLAVVLGGLGIGIGFGLQEITRDFISGLILLLDRSVKVNDYIQLAENNGFKEVKGLIKNISFLVTIIEVDNGGNLIIPNNAIVSAPVLNWSYGTSQTLLEIPIKVQPNTDLVLLAETVLKVAYRNPNILAEPAPQWIFKKIESSYWEFVLQVWIRDVRDQDNIISALNYTIEYYLRQQRIQLAFPTQRFLFDTPPTSPILLEGNGLTINKEISVRDLLKQMVYFNTLNELELRQLVEIGYHRYLKTEEILFDEGDPGDAFYIILEGRVEIFVSKINKQLAILEKGAFFGELALLLGIPRTASVKAIVPTTLFAIDKIKFQNLLQSYPDMAEIIMNSLAGHQEELTLRQKELRKMGLIDENEDDTNPVTWMRKRLGKLFLNK